MSTFQMPSLGADMDEGTLLEWLVKPGDVVHRGDIIAVVDTVKAAVEVECFHDGVIADLVVAPGQTVPVGTVLATLSDVPSGQPAERESPVVAVGVGVGRKLEPAAQEPPHIITSPLVRKLAEREGVAVQSVHPSGAGGRITRSDVASPRRVRRTGERVRATPLARRLAEKSGVALDTLAGTTSAGAVKAADVLAAAIAPTEARDEQAPVPAKVVPAPPHAGMRSAIAGLMERANAEIPHYYLSTTIDMHASMTWLHEHNRQVAVEQRLVPGALILAAIARAAAHEHSMNGEWRDDAFHHADKVNLGLVTSLRSGGVLVPVIPEADTLPVPDVMAAMRGAVQRARTARLRASELTGGTITVTSLGDNGVEVVYGVVFPPQVAIVGVGVVVDRPWACDGMLAVRPVVTVTLAADHRASDGAVGARFLNLIDRLLQHPEEL